MKKFSVLGFAAALLIAAVIFEICSFSGQADDISVASPGNNGPEAAELMKVIMPKNVKSQIKEYEGFTTSFNSETRNPNYSAWELLESETEGAARRSNKFWQDADLSGCPDKTDYSGSGYDRGHLCPAADQKWTPKAMLDCFSMANMCPQWPSLNSGAWNTLEQKCRSWAKRDSALIIVAGPIFERSNKKYLNRSDIRIPDAFFKVILAPYLKEPRAIGFIYPNYTSPGNMNNYAMSIDDVEKETGYDFFSALPDALENRLESNFNLKEWNTAVSGRP